MTAEKLDLSRQPTNAREEQMLRLVWLRSIEWVAVLVVAAVQVGLRRRRRRGLSVEPRGSSC